jgi:hypothetical protein
MAHNETPQPKPRRQPAETADKKTLSGRMFPLFTPDRETSSMVSCGVYAAKLEMLTTRGLLIMLSLLLLIDEQLKQ